MFVPRVFNLLSIQSRTSIISSRSTWKLSRRLEVPKDYIKKPAISPYIVGDYLKDVNPQPDYQEVYDLYDHTNEINTNDDPKEPVQVILLKNVDGIGGMGDVVTVPWEIARFKLIMSQKATYASEFNLKWYKELIESTKTNMLRPSSIESPFTKRGLESTVFALTLSRKTPWTINTRHIRVALRRAGVFVASDESIILPDTPVTGPDMGKQLKVLIATVVINNHERVPTRFVITHHGVELQDDYWAGHLEPVLPEQQELLSTLPVLEKTSQSDA